MEIIVAYKKNWGKDLFYPVSDDARFLAQITGRPTLLKYQLKLFLEKGWKVSVVKEEINLLEYLKL